MISAGLYPLIRWAPSFQLATSPLQSSRKMPYSRTPPTSSPNRSSLPRSASSARRRWSISRASLATAAATSGVWASIARRIAASAWRSASWCITCCDNSRRAASCSGVSFRGTRSITHSVPTAWPAAVRSGTPA
jgi:hypothetical protein